MTAKRHQEAKPAWVKMAASFIIQFFITRTVRFSVPVNIEVDKPTLSKNTNVSFFK